MPAGSPPGMELIKEEDLKRDIFVLASDAFRGREAGTLDEMRATEWLVEHAREAGLEPAGDDGTFVQWWPMRRTVLAENSRVAVGDSTMRMKWDVMMPTPATVTIDLPLVFMENATAAGAGQDLAGKAVAIVVPSTAQMTPVTNALRMRGAGAILIVGDGESDTEDSWSAIVQSRTARGSYTIDTGQVVPPVRPPAANTIPVLRARHKMLSRIQSAASRKLKLTANIYLETFDYPSANVVAKVRGTDPVLRNEYVLFSGHTDHDGVRNIVNRDSANPAGLRDSILNGADDNASVAVALLAIGRAVSKHPMPRSALFVWHGAEERGLLGSRWFVYKPTVPKSSIVAVLNGDMIGRNATDSAALSGWRPPYRNSKALAKAAMDANTNITKFKLDTLWDLPNHCEGWYFRSDHLSYAEAGIPAIFFSTLLHADYHTVRDEPSRIDIPKLAKMTKWMYATGWTIGTTKERPDVDPGFKEPRANRQSCIAWNRPPGGGN